VLVLRARDPVRRAALAGGAVFAAVAVAGLTNGSLPFAGGHVHNLDFSASARPGQAFAVLTGFLGEHPTLWIEALALGAAAGLAAFARERKLWGIAAWGAAFLAVALLAPTGAVSAFPLVFWIWVATVALAVPVLRMRG
jgi:hypothetical protein